VKIILAHKSFGSKGLMTEEPIPYYPIMVGSDRKIRTIHLTHRRPSCVKRLGQKIEDVVITRFSTGQHDGFVLPPLQESDQVWVTLTFQKSGWCSFPVFLTTNWYTSPLLGPSSDIMTLDLGVMWRPPVSLGGEEEIKCFSEPIDECEYDSDRGQSYSGSELTREEFDTYDEWLHYYLEHHSVISHGDDTIHTTDELFTMVNDDPSPEIYSGDSGCVSSEEEEVPIDDFEPITYPRIQLDDQGQPQKSWW